MRRIYILYGLLILIATGGVTLLLTDFSQQSQNSSSETLVNLSTVKGLEQKNGSSAVTSKVNAQLIPPTNSWISGAVLQGKSLAVYPMPLSFLAKDDGFEMGLPKVISSNSVIAGGHSPGIAATVSGMTGFELARFDKTSATLDLQINKKSVADLVIAQGSPFVFLRAKQNIEVSVTNIGMTSSDSNQSYMRYSKDGNNYAIATTGKASISRSGSTALITMPSQSLATFYALPDSAPDTLRQFTGNEITSVEITASAGNPVTTRFKYNTKNQKPTVFVPMPYSEVTGMKPTELRYKSIYGDMKTYKGSEFVTEVPKLKADNSLDIGSLTTQQKQQLKEDLKTDTAATVVTAKDSYFAGKQLARAATLLDISEQLQDQQSSKRLKDILKEAFTKRLSADYFYYDTKLKGISAKTAAFGSEDFNDHHFHYGYFIYAASIYGKYDNSFVTQHKDFINVLVADIASYNQTDEFARQRNYDPYSAHSWAAGLAPFADGNNQESSSEAINAWNGVVMWAELVGNNDLKDSATWMLSNEAETARLAWRSVNTSASYLQNYTSPVSTLNFGGKRTYSTFFSNEPGAKLGIQLLPLSPVMTSFSGDGKPVMTTVAASIQNDNYNVALGDYILMYLALINPDKAARFIDKQQAQFIDGGNSRTYLKAWIFTRPRGLD